MANLIEATLAKKSTNPFQVQEAGGMMTLTDAFVRVGSGVVIKQSISLTVE